LQGEWWASEGGVEEREKITRKTLIARAAQEEKKKEKQKRGSIDLRRGEKTTELRRKIGIERRIA